MKTINTNELLKDADILKEINKHKWLESQKLGYDIGFERASREWIHSYSEQYLQRRPGKKTILWVKSQPFYSVLAQKAF